MNKKIAFAIIIIVGVLSLLCLIWSAYACCVYWEHVIDMVNSADEILGDIRQSSSYKICLIYLFAAINNFLIILGISYLLYYFHKNDFSIPKEERDRIAKEKAEHRMQRKLDKLQAKIDELKKE